MKRKILILLLGVILMPQVAHAQIDAIIDAVVDAVEPTPVYDEGLREATENLASKIERLNRVLFGGAEETSAAYRYMTMYSDLYDLTTAFTSYVERTYNNAHRMERLYSQLDGESSLHDYAYAVESTWYAYDNTVRQGSAIVDRFKKLFADPNTTNAEVRKAAQEAIAALNEAEAEEARRMSSEREATEIAAGLVEGTAFLTPARSDYISEGHRTYGTTLSSGDSGSTTGVVGTAAMVVIGLMSLVYTLFAGIHIMRGTPNAEANIVRIAVVIVVSLLVILGIQASI